MSDGYMKRNQNLGGKNNRKEIPKWVNDMVADAISHRKPTAGEMRQIVNHVLRGRADPELARKIVAETVEEHSNPQNNKGAR